MRIGPRFVVVLCSKELGLEPGTVQDLDDQLKQLSRQGVVIRAISILNALSANRSNYFRELNASFAREIAAVGLKLGSLQTELMKPDTAFLDPFQVLTLLRRAMAISPETGQVDLGSPTGLQVLFDALRFAADVARVREDPHSELHSPDRWLEIAAGLMPRLWFGEQPNVNLILARTRIMLGDAEAVPDLAPRVARLKNRMVEAVGLSFDDMTTLTLFVSYWAGIRSLSVIFKDPGAIRLNPATFLEKTTIPREALQAFLDRTARNWNDTLTDSEIGGPISHLPFRDRPLMRFQDATVAAVMPELLAEKLSGDIFWWLKAPNTKQQQMWQEDWGYIAEAYVVRLLERIARESGASLIPRLKFQSGEIDAAIYRKGHLALVEVTTSRIDDTAANAGDPVLLRQALQKAFVARQRDGQEPYREAVLQLARDIGATLTGQVPGLTSPSEDIQRIYPVMVATDKRVRVPGVWHYLNAQLQAALKPEHASKVSALAVMSLEDLEEADEAVRHRPPSVRGTPPGFLKLLRRWDVERGPVAPSWWQFMQVIYPQYRRNTVLDQEAKKFGPEIESKFWDKDS